MTQLHDTVPGPAAPPRGAARQRDVLARALAFDTERKVAIGLACVLATWLGSMAAVFAIWG